MWASAALGRTVEAGRAHAAELGALNRVARAAMEVAAPGKRVFETYDTDAEAQRLDRALARFDRIRVDADALFSRADHPVHGSLEALAHTLEQIGSEARAVFGDFEAGEYEAANARLATLDGLYSAVSEQVDGLFEGVLTDRERRLGAEADRARWLSRVAATASLGAVVVLVLIALHGRRVSRALARAAADQAERVRALAEANRRAEAANRAKSVFLANMSHEIRTPMTAILGYADVLLEPGHSPSDTVDAIGVIRRNGRHLLSIINDILDISKIEAGRLTVERVECNPIQILSEVYSLMHVRAEEKGLALGVEFVGPIPSRIRTDPTRFRQALLNLVGNAIKFTEAGGVRLVASCDTGGPGRDGRLRIQVIDTGVGMTPDQIERVFEPFTQADASTTRRFGGTGLGLCIAQRLARALGGDIEVDSEPGRGSEFVLTVDTGPIEASSMDPNPSLTAAAPTAAGPSGTQGPARAALTGRVLLAEDGPDNQRLISHILRKAGADVTVVENGALAVESALAARASGAPFGVVLMDMQMPVMDGYAATSTLRRKGYTGPIVALTAHAMTGDRDKCLAAGCDDYITKPVDRGELIGLCAEHMRRAGRAAA